jgi:hypothetical protein
MYSNLKPCNYFIPKIATSSITVCAICGFEKFMHEVPDLESMNNAESDLYYEALQSESEWIDATKEQPKQLLVSIEARALNEFPVEIFDDVDTNAYFREIYLRGYLDALKLEAAKRVVSNSILHGTKEQPTSPSIEKMAEERYPIIMVETRKPFGGIYEADLYYSSRVAFIEGYKSNNSLEELEKWVKAQFHPNNKILLYPLISKIQELKTKQ